MDNEARLMGSDNRLLHLYQAFALLVMALLGFVLIGPLLGALIAVMFSGMDLSSIESFMNNPIQSEDTKGFLLSIQAGATIGMAAIPFLLARYRYNLTTAFYNQSSTDLIIILLAILITFTFMVTNSIIIEWNANLTLPDFMAGFEEWARQTEEAAANMVEFMTDISGVGELLLMLVIIAALPAIAEEYIFRGLVQKKLQYGTGNIHVAIWLSAILFSAIHMQFFGFFPRMLLGALFGYLYFWSGNLWVPISAHFFNNGFMLIMIYLNGNDLIGYDIENSDTPPLSAVAIFAIITFGLIYIFRKRLPEPSSEKLAENLQD